MDGDWEQLARGAGAGWPGGLGCCCVCSRQQPGPLSAEAAVSLILPAPLPLPNPNPHYHQPHPHHTTAHHHRRSYSPVDNIRPARYPSVLVTAGLHDPRVGYWEPAKYVAALRAARTDRGLTLLKCELGAGHFSQSGRFDRLKEVAVEYAFLLKCTGMAAAPLRPSTAPAAAAETPRNPETLRSPGDDGGR